MLAKITIVLLFITIVYLIINLANQEKFIILEKNHKPKTNVKKNIKIPCKIWQTHETNDLPNSSFKNILDLIKKNPEFEYNFFTKEDRLAFMQNNFDKTVVNAYNKINSGAGKSDIWRLAVLLKKGGIYFDSDFKLSANSKKFIDIIDENDEFIHGRNWHVWGVDAPHPNGILCSRANHPVIKKVFNSVIDSINNNKPIKKIGHHEGWTELECYTGTPHLWKALSEYTGNLNLKEGKYKHGIVINNKLLDNLYHEYSNDLTELSTGGGHWMGQKTFNNKKENLTD
jgi:mannosyltransferase OCH1-like enzyme